MDKITKISLPSVTKSIIADTNGKSPFFFYENLEYIDGEEGFTTIGDYAFFDCSSLVLAPGLGG